MALTEFKQLIHDILVHGRYVHVGGHAIDQLVKGGEPALDAFLKAIQHPPKTNLHPRDLHDSISDVYGSFANVIPDAVIDRMDVIGERSTYWALGSATGARSIDVLIQGLASKCLYSRWAAAESLVRRRSKRAVPALIGTLMDRSSFVRSTFVQAMKSNRMFRTPAALPGLRHILSLKSIRQHSPGTWKAAKEVIKMIEEESTT